MLPNLIVIGASRCGTTSLHRYLDLHPQIAMSRIKEPDFFVEERNWHRGVAWYEEQFPEAVPVRGEASTRYTAYPSYRGVPERMFGLVPAVKLVYQVRDPIERALSAYSLSWAMGGEARPLGQALREDTQEGFYLPQGRYWMQLERYLEFFAAERIMVVDQRELRHARRDLLARIFRFVEVDDGFDSSEFDREHNPTPPVRRTRAGSAVVRMLDRALGVERAVRIRAAAPAALRLPFAHRQESPKAAVDDALRDWLRGYFAADVARLRDFTGMAFDGWSV